MPVIPGNNFNRRGVVHFPTDICRTIIGGGGIGGYHAGNEPKIMEIKKIVYDDYNSRIRNDQKTMTTLISNCGANAIRNGVKIITKGCDLTMDGTVEKDGKVYAIRKLTPLECWRLMGFTDEDFHKAGAVNSNTQLYKQAGNSIVKYVLMAIFSQMIDQPKGR